MDTLPSPPAPGWRKGFDVSEYSGHGLDFGKLRDEGASFAILRAGDDVSHVDRNYEAYLQKATDARLDIGTYFAFFAGSDPEAQANFYVSLLRNHPAAMTLAPMIDFELLRGVDPNEAVIRAAAFCECVEFQLGIDDNTMLVYSYPYFVESLVTAIKRSGTRASMAALQKLSLRPLAIAHYDVAAPTVPPPWDDWTVWQCKGNVMRPDGVIDLDYWKGM